MELVPWLVHVGCSLRSCWEGAPDVGATVTTTVTTTVTATS